MHVDEFGEDELRNEARLLRQLLDRYLGAVREEPEGELLIHRLEAHLGARPTTIPVVTASWAPHEQADVQLALERWLADRGAPMEIIGHATPGAAPQQSRGTRRHGAPRQRLHRGAAGLGARAGVARRHASLRRVRPLPRRRGGRCTVRGAAARAGPAGGAGRRPARGPRTRSRRRRRAGRRLRGLAVEAVTGARADRHLRAAGPPGREPDRVPAPPAAAPRTARFCPSRRSRRSNAR